MLTLLSITAAFAAPNTEILSVDVQLGRPATGVVVGIVDGSMEQVLDIVMDCDGTDAWFPDLLDSHTVEGGSCAGRTNLPWPVQDRVWQIDTTASQPTSDTRVASFAYVAGSGNMEAMHGDYVLRQLDDGRTHVTYTASVDLGFWIPEPLVAWATRRVLPGILTGIQGQVADDTRIAMR